MSGYLHSDFPVALLKLQYDVTLEVKPLTQEHPFYSYDIVYTRVRTPSMFSGPLLEIRELGRKTVNS